LKVEINKSRPVFKLMLMPRKLRRPSTQETRYIEVLITAVLNKKRRRA